MKDILTSEIYINDVKRVLEIQDLNFLRNKKVLITGGLGLICSAIIDILLVYNKTQNANIHIFVASRNEANFNERYGKYSEVEFIQYDSTKDINFDVDVDYIIHGAGTSSPELYTSKPVETILSNFMGMLNLLEYARKHSVKRVLYLSSSEVYGTKEGVNAFNENTFGAININNVRCSYSEGKRVSEVLCKSYLSEYGVDSVIVRPGHIYGPTASQKDKKVSSQFAYLAAKGEPIVMKSLGLQKRSYCYSLDCASAILTALKNGEAGESYNIGHDEVTSIRDMALILAEAGNVSIEISAPTEADIKSFNPMDNSTLNNDKIKLLGYKDVFSVKEGLTHTVQILKDIL